MNKERTLDVGGELRDAHSRLNETLGRLAAFAAIAERLGKLPEETELPAPDILMRYGPDPSHNSGQLPGEPKDVRANFAAYCARFAVIGMVTACEEFLQRVLFIAKLGLKASRSGGGVTGSVFHEVREETLKEVRRTSVDMMPTTILGVVGKDDEPLDGLEWFRGIYGIRKCLLHRGGIVGQDDLGNGDVLAATWRKPVLMIGQRELTKLPARAEEGDSISVRFEDAVHEWGTGDAITLTAEDCQYIALTLGLFSGQVMEVCGKGVHELVSGARP